MTISVILQRDVPELGRTGQVVSVSQAYARNFLLPKGLAAVPTPALLAKVKAAEVQVATAKQQVEALGATTAATLGGKSVHLSARANPQGKLFAAIKSDQILKAIDEQMGLTIPASATLAPVQFKTLGDHPTQLTLAHHRITFTVHLDHAE